MPRLNPLGKRLVHHRRKFPVPPEILASIDAQAARVLKLRGDRDDLQGRLSLLDHAVYSARSDADKTPDPGLRKILSNRADDLARQADTLRIELDRAHRSTRQEESVLAGLHAEARAWQQGDREGPQGALRGGVDSSPHARDMP